MLRRVLILSLLIAAVALGASRDPRRLLFVHIFAATTDVPPLDPPVDEGSDVRWFDDYFTVQQIDADTFAIGEPRYHDRNYNYLIVGDERAVLFDSGPGVRDIVPVVRDLTMLPVTALPSHLHYDHIGNHTSFGEIALVDLPFLRERSADSGVLRPTSAEHLGFVEGFRRPYLHVGEWLAVGSEMDLGGRRLQVLHTPGHTRESISLYDRDRDQIFVGDFITEGPTYAFVPTASLGDYLRSAVSVLEKIGDETRVMTAHRLDPPGMPELARDDVVELRDTLLAMKRGELEPTGSFPRMYSLAGGRQVAADLPWGHSWE